MEREPAVAGRFYPADAASLSKQVASFLGPRSDPARPRPALALLAPHAGYLYSGAIAGATYARVQVPERAIVLGPNHTGLGPRVSLWPDGAWRLPIGRVPVDGDLASALLACPLVTPDREAHRLEHALEVQLPFLAALQPAIRIAPLCLGPLPYADCETLGRAVADAARTSSALIVASSDMSHFIPAREAAVMDRLALDRVRALDPEGLHEVVLREDISMCGYIPATVMLVAARELGARTAELVRYGTSGDVTGDMESVVAYAGVVVR